MKLISTRGRGAAQTHEVLAALERRGGAALDTVLPTVRRIVTDVRSRGDRALLKYAAQFDGLAGADCVRVTEQEMAAAWKSVSPELRDALSTAAKQILRLPGSRCRLRGVRLRSGFEHRPTCAAAWVRGLLRAKRQASATFNAADDGDSRAGGGRQAHCCRLSKARA